MAHLFISYSQKDRVEVDKIVEFLELDGYQVWIDRDSIRGGDEWRTQTAKAIEDADAIIVVLSRNSIQSQWVYRELVLAEEEEKKIVPVALHEVSIPTKMKMQLAGIQIIRLGKGFNRGLNQLKKALEHRGIRPEKRSEPGTNVRRKRQTADAPEPVPDPVRPAKPAVSAKVVLKTETKPDLRPRDDSEGSDKTLQVPDIGPGCWLIDLYAPRSGFLKRKSKTLLVAFGVKLRNDRNFEGKALGVGDRKLPSDIKGSWRSSKDREEGLMLYFRQDSDLSWGPLYIPAGGFRIEFRILDMVNGNFLCLTKRPHFDLKRLRKKTPYPLRLIHFEEFDCLVRRVSEDEIQDPQPLGSNKK